MAEGATVLGAEAGAGAGAGAVVAWPADGRACRGWRGRCAPYRCEGSMSAWMEVIEEVTGEGEQGGRRIMEYATH